MMYPRDSLLLALTKLKTRRIRMVVAVIISSLLFGILAGGSLVVRGFQRSVGTFSEEGYGKRYILNAYTGNADAPYRLSNDKDFIAAAEQADREYLAARAAAAKKLNLPYDPETDTKLVITEKNAGETIKYVDTGSPRLAEVFKIWQETHPPSNLDDVKKETAKYNPKDYYTQYNQDFNGPTYFKPLKDGVEDYKSLNADLGETEGIGSFAGKWTLQAKNLLEPFLLNGESLEIKDGIIPIFAPFSAAQELVDLPPLPKQASTADKLARVQEVQDKAKGITFTACYRNQESLRMLQQAKEAQDQIQKAKQAKLPEPALDYILEYPKTACAEPAVSKDLRSAEAKALATAQAKFDQQFGMPAPASMLFTFRVVGFVPDVNGISASTASQIIQSIVGSSLPFGWYSPNETLVTSPLMNQIFVTSHDSGSLSGPSYYVEIADADSAKRLLKDTDCLGFFGDPVASSADSGSEDEPFKCNGHQFTYFPYGSNALGLKSIEDGFTKYFRIATMIIAAVSAIIMMGTVGRIIADSRRETAVFRAIGAKRLDIAQIYFTYSILLGILISIAVSALGVLGALLLHQKYSGTLTVEAQVAYNAYDLTKQFGLFWIRPMDFLFLFALILAAAIVSASLPLSGNLRRNPINDMRDER